MGGGLEGELGKGRMRRAGTDMRLGETDRQTGSRIYRQVTDGFRRNSEGKEDSAITFRSTAGVGSVQRSTAVLGSSLLPI